MYDSVGLPEPGDGAHSKCKAEASAGSSPESHIWRRGGIGRHIRFKPGIPLGVRVRVPPPLYIIRGISILAVQQSLTLLEVVRINYPLFLFEVNCD